MEYRFREEKGAHIVELIEQEFSVRNAWFLKGLVRKSLNQGCKAFILDMSSVTSVDSAGLVTLLACHKMCDPEVRLILAGANRYVLNSLSITRLNKIINVASSSEEALIKLNLVNKEMHPAKSGIIERIGSIFSKPAVAR